MNLVDSSGWLEYFSDGKNAAAFSGPIEDVSHLVVPTISLTEVFKKILREKGEQAALQVVAHMSQAHVIDLDTEIALLSAKLGVDHKLPLADSVILATARKMKAILWTQDEDFKGLEGVRYIAKHESV